MVEDAATHWDHRFATAPEDWFRTPRSFLLDHLELLPRQGLALDAAMGTGQNAALLIEHGLQVVGIDISRVGVVKARKRAPQIMAVVADLEHFVLPSQHFDVILNLYYLQRDLFPQYKKALKPGGLLIFETLTQEMRLLKPDLRADFLLAPGELRQAFASWEILVYREGWIKSDHGHNKAVASLIARRPPV
ncbi:MAG TPA: class I SAM-dependent methyltransferase [Anaerolineaceae bacterium]|nr:class I SAM-dependent methyltransferase [Anaerolineaceae bacterium]